MNNEDYDEDEREVISDFEGGTYQSNPNLAEREKELQQAARNTQNKTRNINIRLTEKDLARLKAKAVEEGIPYQTLVTSILHKAASGYRPVSDQERAPAFFNHVFVNPTVSHSKAFEAKENPNE